MKEEVYNKMVLKLGIEKADNVKKLMEEANVRKQEVEKFNREVEEKMLEVGINKEDLEDCAYYHGVRFRGHGIAQWDEKIGKFIILAYEFRLPVIEELEHFADVVEIRYDGFVPFEKIDKYKYYDIRKTHPNKIKEEVERRKRK